MSFDQFQDNMHAHPVIAMVISTCSIVLGFLFKILQVTITYRIPPLFIDILQCLCYMFGIAVSAITVYTFIKKKK